MSFSRLPVVAVVGRPNVGKSSLYNALVGRRAAIVDNSRGVTRDRLYDEARLGELRFHVVDTGGIEPDSKDPILKAMREQAHLAIDEADVVVFLVDGRDGVLPADREIASLLRRSSCPHVLAINKIDDAHHDGEAYEFAELGLEPSVALSAIHRRGFEELEQIILELLPAALGESATADARAQAAADEAGDDLLAQAEAAQGQPDDGDEEPNWDGMPEEISVAVVGRPNVGKSSMINKLLGEERLLVADMPGTTRDSVDTVLTYGERRYRLIDTAGLRRKRSIAHRLERYSVVASLNAVSRAQVVVLVIDADQPVADQDQQVAAHAARHHKALVVAANKMDLVRRGDRPRRDVLESLRDSLRFIDYAPVVPVTAKTGHRVFDVLVAVEEVASRAFKRIPTSAVNRVLQELTRHQPPPVVARGRAKLLFGAQVATSPPTFVIVCRRPDALQRAYRKFVERRLREAFDFAGVPLLVAFRSRERQAERSKQRRKKAARE